jgi:hypothetical protein
LSTPLTTIDVLLKKSDDDVPTPVWLRRAVTAAESIDVIADEIAVVP